MDKIVIEDLQVETIIGVYTHERQQKQFLFISAELSVDIAQAAQNDDILLAVDYAAVAELITAFSAQQGYYLIETLAEKIAQLVLNKFPIKHIHLSVSKPSAIINAKNTRVIIERHKL